MLDEHLLVRTARDTVDLLLAGFNKDKVVAVLWEDQRIAMAGRKRLLPRGTEGRLFHFHLGRWLDLSSKLKGQAERS